MMKHATAVVLSLFCAALVHADNLIVTRALIDPPSVLPAAPFWISFEIKNTADYPLDAPSRYIIELTPPTGEPFLAWHVTSTTHSVAATPIVVCVVHRAPQIRIAHLSQRTVTTSGRIHPPLMRQFVSGHFPVETPFRLPAYFVVDTANEDPGEIRSLYCSGATEDHVSGCEACCCVRREQMLHVVITVP
jgi:hypothetical protein